MYANGPSTGPSEDIPVTYTEDINDPQNTTARDGYIPAEGKDNKEDPGLVSEGSSLGEGEDILAKEDVDPALSQKMHLVNNVSTPDM